MRVENSAIVAAKTCSTRLTAVADSSLAETFVHVRDLDPDRVPDPLYHSVAPCHRSQTVQIDRTRHHLGTAVRLVAAGVTGQWRRL